MRRLAPLGCAALLACAPPAEPAFDVSALSRESLHAPHLLDLEVAQVLRRYARSGVLTARRGEQALEDLVDLPVARYPHEFLLARIWELRDRVTAYDAAYLALAEALAAPLVTRDAALASSRAHRATVELM